MKKISSLALFLAVISSPALADERMVDLRTPGIHVTGLNDRNEPTIGAKVVRWSFQDNDDWQMQCGRYVMNHLINRLERYNTVEQANILGHIDEVIIREPRGGLLGRGSPHVQYDNSKRRLIVEFTRDARKSGAEYCRMGAVREAWAQYERWSGRRNQIANVTLPAPAANVEPRINHEALDAATQNTMNGLMNRVLRVPAPAPSPSAAPSATDRRERPEQPAPAPAPAPQAQPTPEASDPGRAE
jgi:hypothetical protein